MGTSGSAMDVPRMEVIGITGIPEVRAGDRLGPMIVEAAAGQRTAIEAGDVVVVTQKIVSKAESRLVSLQDVEPSAFAVQLSAESERDPRVVELVLRESRSIVRVDPARGVLIVETKHGFICANAGIDSSNVPGDEVVSLLPEDSDRSAREIRDELAAAVGVEVGVIVSDTFGRPWREGHVDFAIGVAGLDPFHDYRGSLDAQGKVLHVTRIALADELSAAAEVVMGKALGIPVAIVRGVEYRPSEGGSSTLLRDRSEDLFR
jgi:coenzyme F420-0:L-glutamate ligase/coenzyme F420-1:gamma-L-glutamate ligase